MLKFKELDKKLKIYIGLLIFIILSIVYIESAKPKEINWFPSYVANHKIPYGTYILHKELPSLFSKNKVKDIYQNPYLFLKDSTRKGTYLFIDNTLNFGDDEFEELLDFVERGNNVFIATNGIYIDTLNVRTKQLSTSAFEEKAYQKMSNPEFGNKEYYFDRDFPKRYFSEIDTLNTTILGEMIIKDGDGVVESTEANYIRTKYGKGYFYLHTFPQAFTNYSMLLEDNYEYVGNVLSYLDKNNSGVDDRKSYSDNIILWDTYYKTGKSRIASPMHYVLSSKHLKWAYYVALIGVLFFIVFKGKRKQRFIPVITPLKNQTLAFTRTIANMYYEKSDHKNIASHKINYFLEYIRTTYRLSTLKIDEAFYEKLSSRSGNSYEDIVNLFKKIDAIASKEHIKEEELIALNKAIEAFKE